MEIPLQVGLIGLGGVVVGAGIAMLKDWLLPRLKAANERRHLSLMIAFALDRYVDGCALVATDHGEEDSDGFVRATARVPKLMAAEVQGDWRTLDISIIEKVHSLQFDAEFGAEQIRSAFEFSTPPDYEPGFTTRREIYANLGIRAFDLGSRLRANAGAQPRTTFGWPYAQLLAVQSEIAEQKSKRQARSPD